MTDKITEITLQDVNIKFGIKDDRFVCHVQIRSFLGMSAGKNLQQVIASAFAKAFRCSGMGKHCEFDPKLGEWVNQQMEDEQRG